LSLPVVRDSGNFVGLSRADGLGEIPGCDVRRLGGSVSEMIP